MRRTTPHCEEPRANPATAMWGGNTPTTPEANQWAPTQWGTPKGRATLCRNRPTACDTTPATGNRRHEPHIHQTGTAKHTNRCEWQMSAPVLHEKGALLHTQERPDPPPQETRSKTVQPRPPGSAPALGTRPATNDRRMLANAANHPKHKPARLTHGWPAPRTQTRPLPATTHHRPPTCPPTTTRPPKPKCVAEHTTQWGGRRGKGGRVGLWPTWPPQGAPGGPA